MDGGSRLTACINRLTSDFNRIKDDAPAGVSGGPRDDNFMVWDAIIFGPPESPWDGGLFKLTLEFNQDYPMTPPTVRFVSEMFHPNVYNNGGICLDILQNKWSPAYGAVTILASIQSLLCDPNPNSPANPEAARLYCRAREVYNKRVRQVVEESLRNLERKI